MDLIRNHYRQIISYGLIFFGIAILIAILIVRPSRQFLEETDTFTQKPETNIITFPYKQFVKIPDQTLSFLELRFGNDSINQYSYDITASFKSTTLFSHTYQNETSNIVRIPIDYSIIDLSPGEEILITISCNESNCKNAKFDLYNSDKEHKLKTLYGYRKPDYGLLWYGLFPIVFGLTLAPLTKEGKKP